MLYYNIINLWDHRRTCSLSLTETSLCGAYLYISLHVKCTERIEFMLYHKKRINHKKSFTEQWLMNNECEREIWKEAVEAEYEVQSGGLL
jgi:hypothetical protein